VKALGTPLVEVKEDVLSKAKNGSPERKVKKIIERRRNEMKPAVLNDSSSYPPAAKTFTICWVNLIAHLVYSNLEGCNASTAK
jgi:hypothetical protein